MKERALRPSVVPNGEAPEETETSGCRAAATSEFAAAFGGKTRRVTEARERPLLSVVMPVYNEHDTVSTIIERVLGSKVASLELLVVDDASGDGTRDVLEREWTREPRVRLLFHDHNQGKGAALRTGFRAARGEFVLVQDADLEYDPADYPALLEPLVSGHADVVFGSRFQGGTHRVLYFWHFVGNRVLTTLS